MYIIFYIKISCNTTFFYKLPNNDKTYRGYIADLSSNGQPKSLKRKAI